jgi:hypothetical protein
VGQRLLHALVALLKLIHRHRYPPLLVVVGGVLVQARPVSLLSLLPSELKLLVWLLSTLLVLLVPTILVLLVPSLLVLPVPIVLSISLLLVCRGWRRRKGSRRPPGAATRCAYSWLTLSLTRTGSSRLGNHLAEQRFHRLNFFGHLLCLLHSSSSWHFSITCIDIKRISISTH